MKTCSIEFEDKSVDLTGCDDCSECNGEGGFWVGWPEEEWETCDNCSGTGVDSSDYNAAMWTAYYDDLEKEKANSCSSENLKIDQ